MIIGEALAAAAGNRLHFSDTTASMLQAVNDGMMKGSDKAVVVSKDLGDYDASAYSILKRLIFNSYELTLLQVMSILLKPIFSQISVIYQSCETIQHASDALITLQRVNDRFKDNISVTLANRLQTEEAMTSSINIMQSFFSQR